MAEKKLRKARLVVKETNHACFFQPHDRAFRHRDRAAHSEGLTGQASFPEEVAGA